MSKYNVLYKCIVRSVDHIFKNFFHDGDIDEVFDAQSTKDDPSVYVEIKGALKGEIMINIPEKTLNYQWKNHDIGGNTLISDKTQWQIYFAHFYPLQSKNQDFKNNERNISEKLKDNLSVDELLKEKLERIF